METTLQAQIKDILEEVLMAENRFFMGEPACPTIIGIDEAVVRITELINNIQNENTIKT